MIKKNILIFEDEWETIRGSFELANICSFGENLQFNVKPRSQDVDFSSLTGSYDAIFIDITLAKNSQMDGFHIVRKIIDGNLFPLSKIVILTGNNKVVEKLTEMGIDSKKLQIEYKPIDFDKLSKILTTIIANISA